MVVNMYHGDDNCCGAFLTGGTESILMAMKTYRDKGKAERGITHPNIVVCTTAHAAFDKAGHVCAIVGVCDTGFGKVSPPPPPAMSCHALFGPCGPLHTYVHGP